MPKPPQKTSACRNLAVPFCALLPLILSCSENDDLSSISDDSSDLSAQYRRTPEHRGTASTESRVSEDMILKWQTPPFAIGSYTASVSSPAVDSDSLYVGGDDGRLLSLNRQDGSLRWEFRTRRYTSEQNVVGGMHLGIHGSPALDDARVVIGDYDGYLYAIDRKDGALIWETRVGDSIGASPTIFDGIIYISVEFAQGEGKVVMVSVQDGRILWQTPFLGNHPHSSASIDVERNLFFVGTNDGRLYCFDIAQRTQRWVYETEGEIKSTPAISNGVVYFTSWDTKLHSVDIATGRQKFTVDSGSWAMSSPAVSRGVVYFGSDDTQVYAADAHSGDLLWVFNTGGAVQSSPTVVEESGVVVIGSRDHSLYVLDAASGRLIHSESLPGAMTSVPVVVGNELFVNDDTGTVSCFVSPQ